MPRTPHSAAFLAVRDALLALDDADRRPLARLFGAMQDEQPDPSAATIAILRAIAALDDADVVRLARWFRKFANRWGQVPSASSERLTPADRLPPPTT
ncbi:MAG: hypothetical protein IAI48_00535 [Candidatus Eremiobacteraeota bacterium]|nr:hypothetical protein [Candidatus Eremiobacteraeota bacterium]